MDDTAVGKNTWLVGLLLRLGLLVEWAVLFIACPIVIYWQWLDLPHLVIFLLPVIYTVMIDRRCHVSALNPAPPAGFSWSLMLLRVTSGAVLFWVLTVTVVDATPFLLPRQQPRFWCGFMVLYPLLSVWPQEFVYRRFFFWRYQSLFPSKPAMIAASALCFAFVHIIYDNWIAVTLSLAGGLIFSLSYQTTGRLLYPWLEHSLFGQLLFTIGLGDYFHEPLG